MVALRQRQGRTLTFVIRREDEGVDIDLRNVKAGTVTYADEATHWDRLGRAFPSGRINHSEAYSMDGAHTNNVES